MSQTGLDAYLDVEERESRKVQKGTIAKLLRQMALHPLPLLGGIVLVLAGTAATLAEPRLFGYAIDEAIIPGMSGLGPDVHAKSRELLRTITLIFLLTTCVRVAATIGAAYFFEILGQRVGQDLRIALFSHLQRLPVSVYDKNPAGRLLTRVTNDISAMNEMFAGGIVTMVSNALTVLGILAWLLYLDLRLGLISASVFPVLMWVSIHFSRKLSVAYREARSKLSALNAFLAENLLGMKVVHLFNRQSLHKERFDRINNWYAEAQFGTVRVFALFQPAITIAAGVSIALVIWYGGIEVASDRMAVGVLVAYFAYVLSLFQPLRELADKWSVFLSGVASAERIFSILSWPTELDEDSAARKPKPIEGLRGHIQFENVWFAYDRSDGGASEHWVLKDFSLEIRPGMKVGVVGHTGAGKTTLISLLMRFYEPQKGRILLDGKDLREYDRRDLRASIGIIQQDAFLFSGSLRDNITFWSDGKGVQERIDQVLQGMGFKPGWADQELLERGSNVSIGEKQALAFARAVITDPRIWILDEATANMDSQTEEVMQKQLQISSRDRTTIIIAHRLATVRAADMILVLHKGALLEKGSHDELVRLNGLYARLFRYQKAQALTEAATGTDQPSRLGSQSV